MISIITPTEQYGLKISSEICFEFNQNIVLGAGYIELTRLWPQTLIESFKADASPGLRIEGSKLYIKPSNKLENGKDYFVTFKPAAIFSTQGEEYIQPSVGRYWLGTESYDVQLLASDVNEGDSAVFTFASTAHIPGQYIYYSIGASSDDVAGGGKEDVAVINNDYKVVISLPVYADNRYEGVEDLTLYVYDSLFPLRVVATKTIKIIDTSVPQPVYQLTPVSSSVNEGGNADFTLTTANVQSGTSLSYSISGVSASDIVGGSLDGIVVVDDSNGRTTISIPIAADLTTEGAETITVAVQNISVSVTINDTSKSTPLPTYILSSTSSSVNEGDIATFTLSTTNVQLGTAITYVVSGITDSDITNGIVNGSVSIDAAGLATIAIPISADKVTEGIETLTVTVEGKSVAVQILDTSKQATQSTYTIAPSTSSANEGSTAKFTVSAAGVVAGTSETYTLSGLSAEDIVGGEINGSVVLDALGMGTISVPIAADNKTEGSESLTVTVGSATSTITVNDTSKSTSQYYISASDGIVSEGKVATFTVSAADGVMGTKIAYTVSGLGINAKDISNGKLSGSVAVGADSTATITVPIAADKTAEGDEDLTVTLTGLGISETITVEDTSTAAPTVATYTLEAIESSVKEGEAAEFLLETAGVKAGTKLKYTITGVSNADLAEKKLSGTVAVSEDGTATITLPTAIDALTEGTETLTLTINGQKVNVALLDDTSVKVSETVLEGAEISLYKTSLGGFVLATPGLETGDALDDYVPLKASAIKDYALPKGLSAVLGYEDGSFGLIIKIGAGSKASFSEQKFSEDGIAKGKAGKLSAGQVLAKETVTDTDINGDGVIGEVIAEVYDDDGDVNQQDYGLYKTSSGAVVLGAVELAAGDTAGSGVTLMASKTKGWVVPSGTSVAGIAITDGGSLEVLTLKGRQYSAQTFDAETGIAKGKATALKTAQIDAREYYYGLDLTGDDDISLVGQETMPLGWVV